NCAMPVACPGVVATGEIRACDPVEIVHRPDHNNVAAALVFRAMSLVGPLWSRAERDDEQPPGDAASPNREKKRRDDRTLSRRHTPDALSTKLLTILLP
ncbi:hypothetical protein ACFC18_50730, partial [Streptomyces sp. NPDC056121]